MVYTKVYDFVNKFQSFQRAILDQSNFVENTNFDKIENTRVKFRYSCLMSIQNFFTSKNTGLAINHINCDCNKPFY